MKYILGVTASVASMTMILGASDALAQNSFNGYEYIEGSHYTSPYAGNNVGEWSYGKDPDSRCYHGNYGFNGQTTNYDPSKCVVVYDAQTYVRLLRGSSSMGGTEYFGN